MYAGFWKRFFANIIDTIVIYTLFYLVLMLVGYAILSISPDSWLFSLIEFVGFDIVERLMTILLVIVIWGSPVCSIWLYYAIMESSRCRGTLGKMALGIAVVDQRYETVSFGRASIRFWSRIISFLTLKIGYLMAGFTKKKQALHDMIAGTYVVNKNMLEIGYHRPESVQNSTEGQEPQDGLGQAY